MCYQWKSLRRPEELTIEDWKDFVSSLKHFVNRQSHVHLVGGEPLIKKHILELVRYISSQDGKFISDIVTNAVLIDEAMARGIVDSGLSTIIFSLESLKPEVHDYLRGFQGCYSKLMSAIEYVSRYRSILNRHIDIGIQTIILAHNLGELIDLLKWVESDSTIQFISFQIVKQPLNSPEDAKWYLSDEFGPLWPKDVAKVTKTIDTIIEMKKNKYSKISNEVPQLELYKAYYQNPGMMTENICCNIFNQVVIVDPVGNVSFCSRTGNIGNIKEKPLEVLWNSPEAGIVRKRILNCKNICRHIMFNYSYDNQETKVNR
jgi:MoaA/NifB/PqqE/SkfB family radical SAM enzyme